mmetsp:Transcript_37108/g.115475  ORF Transcript_37108/g.115475 Transcript_37108/m.115475 type:complete len:211 (+) Transcript_37108:206-838(+)
MGVGTLWHRPAKELAEWRPAILCGESQHPLLWQLLVHLCVPLIVKRGAGILIEERAVEQAMGWIPHQVVDHGPEPCKARPQIGRHRHHPRAVQGPAECPESLPHALEPRLELAHGVDALRIGIELQELLIEEGRWVVDGRDVAVQQLPSHLLHLCPVSAHLCILHRRPHLYVVVVALGDDALHMVNLLQWHVVQLGQRDAQRARASAAMP